MKMKSVALTLTVALGLLLAHPPAAAQETCQPAETIGKCWDRLIEAKKDVQEAVQADVQTEAQNEQWERLTSKATGPDTSDLNLESATEDFLPLLRFGLATAGLQDGLDRTALNFERKIGLWGPDSSWEAKLKGSVNDADVFAPLKMAFQEDIREQRVAALKNKLEDFDDYSLTASANRKSESYGRSPNDYSRQVFRSLLQQVVATTPFDDRADVAFADALRTANDELKRQRAEQRSDPAPSVPAQIDGTTSFEQVPATVRAELHLRLVEAARGLVRTREDLKRNAESLGIFRVADLLNNQPQINFDGSYRLREDIAGPDEIKLKASYEHGFASLNRLRRRCGSAPTGNLEAFANCYKEFIEDPEVKSELEHGDRVSLTAEYNETKAYGFSLPADDIALELDRERGWTIELAYARFIDLGNDDDSSRVDLTGRYESADDRGVITASYTNRLLRSLGGSLGISYANHAKFLPDSEREVNAHLSFSFKSFGEEPESSPSR